MEVYTPGMSQTQAQSRSRRIVLSERRRALRLAAALPWAVLVAGCGQKGPLYHPPEPDEEREDDQTNATPPRSGSRLA